MQSKIGEIYEGKVTGITNFGAFVKLSNGESGMVHISEVAPVYVKDINEHLSEGQDVKVKVIAINENKISLSIKQALPKPASAEKRPERKNDFRKSSAPSQSRPYNQPANTEKSNDLSFEEMMAKFKQVSDEKMSDLKRSSDMGGKSRRSNGR